MHALPVRLVHAANLLVFAASQSAQNLVTSSMLLDAALSMLRPRFGALFAALAFPIGLDDTGTPAGLQISAPPGDDGLMLSLGLAMERLFGLLPAPPTTAACSGCTANVTYVPVCHLCRFSQAV